jgi:hypothetical protein
METTTKFKCIVALISFLMLGISPSVHAQTNYYFYVQLANKNNSPYSLNNPSVYLSHCSRRFDYIDFQFLAKPSGNQCIAQ